MKQQISVVDDTLNSLGFADKPRILVLNKIDLLNDLELSSLTHGIGGLLISSHTRVGFEELLIALQEELRKCFHGQDPGRFTELAPC
jgi:50S ribosomal subunit-associated GTPase HflX